MGSISSSQSSRSRYGRSSQLSSDITIETLIANMLSKIDLYGIVITQAALYMQKVRESQSQRDDQINEDQIDASQDKPP
jgi:hypothetical protein